MSQASDIQEEEAKDWHTSYSSEDDNFYDSIMG